MKGPGQPKSNIDWKLVDKLLIEGNSGVQIAAYIGISAETLYDRTLLDQGVLFSRYSQEKHAKGESLLKTKQHDIAMKGNVTMLIWLGKQRLDQSEKIEKTPVIPNELIIDKDNENKLLKHELAKAKLEIDQLRQNAHKS